MKAAGPARWSGGCVERVARPGSGACVRSLDCAERVAGSGVEAARESPAFAGGVAATSAPALEPAPDPATHAAKWTRLLARRRFCEGIQSGGCAAVLITPALLSSPATCRRCLPNRRCSPIRVRCHPASHPSLSALQSVVLGVWLSPARSPHATLRRGVPQPTPCRLFEKPRPTTNGQLKL